MKRGSLEPSPGDAEPLVRIRHGRLKSVAPRAWTPDTPKQPHVVERGGKLVVLRDTRAPVAKDSSEAVDDPLVGQPTGKVEAALITLFIMSLLLPVSWKLGSVRLAPFTVFLALGFIPTLFVWLRGQKTPVMLPDILILVFCCWSSAALALAGGLAESLEGIGIQVLTTLGAYLTGRILVRDARAFCWLVAIAVAMFALMLPALLVETLTGKKPLLELGSWIGTRFPAIVMSPRMGFARAQGPFEHPIAMGIFAAGLFSLAVYVLRIDRRWPVLGRIGAPVSVLASLLSVSTAALLSLNVQIGLTLWSRALRGVKHRWQILAAILVALYVAIDTVSVKTPFHVFVNYATFSSGSSYNRILIWQYGSAEALRHPLFGIGMNDWTRPSWMHASMDNFWLVVAVRYGIPSFLLLGGAIFLVIRRMKRVNYHSEELVLMRRGIVFSLTGTMVAVASSHLWNAPYVWFLFLVGASGFLAAPKGAAGNRPVTGGRSATA